MSRWSFRKKVVIPNETAIFNILIKSELLDKEYRFANAYDLFRETDRLRDLLLKLPYGQFSVMNSGKLVRGWKDNLTYRVCIISSFEFDHAHYAGTGGIEDFTKKDGCFYLDNRGCRAKPLYNLRGLYNTLPNLKIHTKIQAMCGLMGSSHSELLKESLATRKITRLKLAENKYNNMFPNPPKLEKKTIYI